MEADKSESKAKRLLALHHSIDRLTHLFLSLIQSELMQELDSMQMIACVGWLERETLSFALIAFP